MKAATILHRSFWVFAFAGFITVLDLVSVRNQIIDVVEEIVESSPPEDGVNLSMHPMSKCRTPTNIEDNPNVTSVLIRRKDEAYPAPIMNDTGVVVFFHSPKTGGSTIRENLIKYYGGERIHFHRVRYMQEDRRKKQVAKHVLPIVKGDRKEILFLELHGTIPGLSKLDELVSDWRCTAAKNSVPFFAFTLVREPVSFSQSYFMFFHQKDCNLTWCETELYDATQENLRKSVKKDRQCTIFTHGQEEEKSNSTPPADEDECNAVFDTMLSDWDWVGTTETMKTSTLPLITHILDGNATAASAFEKFKNQGSTNAKKLGELTSTTIGHIKYLNQQDTQLWEKVRSHYSLTIPGLSM